MRVRYYAGVVWVELWLASVLFIVLDNGLKMGIDFEGGVVVQVQLEKAVEDEALKKSLDLTQLP